MHESSLVADDLCVAYGAVVALRGVSISVPPGACVALVGANGAGKSTFLNAISGMVRPQSGDVWFGGQSILRRPAYKIARAGLVHIPEGRGILPSLTVRDNINVVLHSIGKGSDPAEVYDLFPKLRERERQIAGTLSGGEQQMLAIALGLLARPRLIAIDEPSLGLAPILIQEVFHALGAVKERGVSLLLVEQYVNLVMGLADVVYILDKGSVVFSGPPAELERSALADVYLGSHAVGAADREAGLDRAAHRTTDELEALLAAARELRALERQAEMESDARRVEAILQGPMGR